MLIQCHSITIPPRAVLGHVHVRWNAYIGYVVLVCTLVILLAVGIIIQEYTLGIISSKGDSGLTLTSKDVSVGTITSDGSSAEIKVSILGYSIVVSSNI